MRFGFREFVFLFVLLSVPVASYWFVFKPQNQEIQQALTEIQHKEQMLTRLAHVTSQTEDLAALNEEIMRAISMIESRLPSLKEVEVVLSQVAELARSHSLSLSRVRSDRPVQAAAYMEQPLNMTISGDFDRFYTFLLDLEQLERITRVPRINIERNRDVDGAMKAEFTLSIYFEQDDTGGRA